MIYVFVPNRLKDRLSGVSSSDERLTIVDLLDMRIAYYIACRCMVALIGHHDDDKSSPETRREPFPQPGGMRARAAKHQASCPKCFDRDEPS